MARSNKRQSTNKPKVIEEEQPSEKEWAVEAILKWKRNPNTQERFFEILYSPTIYSRVEWNDTGRADAHLNGWKFVEEVPEDGSTDKVVIRWKPMVEPESNLECPELIDKFTSKNPKPWDDDDDDEEDDEEEGVPKEDSKVDDFKDDFKENDNVEVKVKSDLLCDSMNEVKDDSKENVKEDEESITVNDRSPPGSKVTESPRRIKVATTPTRSSPRLNREAPLTPNSAFLRMMENNNLTLKRKRYDGTDGEVDWSDVEPTVSTPKAQHASTSVNINVSSNLRNRSKRPRPD